jgi:hypothetical protein
MNGDITVGMVNESLENLRVLGFFDLYDVQYDKVTEVAYIDIYIKPKRPIEMIDIRIII